MRAETERNDLIVKGGEGYQRVDHLGVEDIVIIGEGER